LAFETAVVQMYGLGRSDDEKRFCKLLRLSDSVLGAVDADLAAECMNWGYMKTWRTYGSREERAGVKRLCGSERFGWNSAP